MSLGFFIPLPLEFLSPTEQVSDELYKLKRLETLCLGNNRILTIPPTIGALTALRTVNLAGKWQLANERKIVIVYLMSISVSCKFALLSFQGNRIDTFPLGLTQCRHLDSVNLSRNKISSVPQGMDNLQAMELNLNQNQISFLDKSIAKCSRLKVRYCVC